MEFRVLRYFLAVAREKSMTGAANVLHVTQPTLSRQIRDLEDELGTQLFERHSHSVTLTADGMRLRKRAEEMEELYTITPVIDTDAADDEVSQYEDLDDEQFDIDF